MAGLLLAAVFISVTLFIGFFHTEKTIRPNSACPACQLQVSSLATCASQPAVVPDIRPIGRPVVKDIIHDGLLIAQDRTSRAPPRG